jgi:hypothetical protein
LPRSCRGIKDDIDGTNGRFVLHNTHPPTTHYRVFAHTTSEYLSRVLYLGAEPAGRKRLDLAMMPGPSLVCLSVCLGAHFLSGGFLHSEGAHE